MVSFICKKRKPPRVLEGLEAVIRRLPESHSAYPIVLAKLGAVKAGFGGEQELDHVFDTYELPMEYKVFHDLSLRSSTHFQIDTLFLTPWHAVILEVKNISGELSVLQNPPQLIRTSESGQVTGFNSPVAQLENNCELFKDWLHSRQKALPVSGAVVLAYPKQRVRFNDSNARFLFPNTVPRFLRSLSQEGSPALDVDEFEALAADLLRSHNAYMPAPICKTYGIEPAAIERGVGCPECGKLGMVWRKRKWECESCGERCGRAHQQAIRDWFLLFGGKMRNKDCREFLLLEKQQNANRLLREMELQTEGANRNRSYSLWLSEDRKERT